MTQDRDFKGRQFTAEVILWAVRWYLMFPISYRDLELMLQDRGVEVDHTTLFRWIQAYAPELEKRIRPHLRAYNGSWRVDETRMRAVASSLFYSVHCHRPISSCVSVRRRRGGAPCGKGGPRQPRIRRDSVRATIPCSGRRSSEASGATLRHRCCQPAHVSSRLPLPRPHRASSVQRFWPDPSPHSPVFRRPIGLLPCRIGVFCQTGFSSAPCGTAPSWRYRQSATRSFLASATIMTLRRRPREPPRRSWNQRESAQPGW